MRKCQDKGLEYACYVPHTMHRYARWILCLALLSCSKSDKAAPQPRGVGGVTVETGKISGRICHNSGTSWHKDVLVYTHLVDEAGRLTDTVTTYSDEEGRFELSDLPGHTTYTLFATHGGDTLWREKILVGPGEHIALDEPACLDPTRWTVAVITGDGQVQRSVEAIGLSVTTVVDGKDPAALSEFLLNPDTLSDHTILFFDPGHIEAGILYSAPETKDGHDTAESHDTGTADDTGDGPDTGEDPDTAASHDTASSEDTGSETDTGEAPDTGVAPDTGEGPAPSYDTSQILDNLRQYVHAGGTIYALDWAYDVVELTFPDHLTTVAETPSVDAAQVGQAGDIQATVADPAMAQWVGKETITVVNHLPMWPVVATTTGTAYLTADAPHEVDGVEAVQASAPLLMSWDEGEGHLVLSTFRLGPSANADMLAATQRLLITLQDTAQ